MRTPLKRLFYRASKAVGLFHLSRPLTRHGLRILCYHGFATGDEGAFRPRYYMEPAEFERRMRFLAAHDVPVLSLADAVTALDRGELPAGATVVTIDDGMASVHDVALPALQRYGFPSVLYVTSYYFAKQTPIFMLVVSYMFWKTRRQRASLAGIGVPDLDNGEEVVLTPAQKNRLADIIVDWGQSRPDNAERVALCRALGERLDVDYQEIVDRRFCSLVTPDELQAMAASGMAVELHTHRHTLPRDPDRARQEIDDNRAALEPLLGRTLSHFCYPSGDWSTEHWPVLAERGVATATTCEPGLVYANTPRLALNRILDSSEVSQIEFEAEMYGYSELIRRVKRAIGRRRSPAAAAG